MNVLGSAQMLIVIGLGMAAFALEAFAFVDALRHRPDAYVAAGKRTKQFWTIVTGIAALLGFVFLFQYSLGFLSILAVVAAAIYLADVRPALQQVSGRGRGSSQGPYGPW